MIVDDEVALRGIGVPAQPPTDELSVFESRQEQRKAISQCFIGVVGYESGRRIILLSSGADMLPI